MKNNSDLKVILAAYGTPGIIGIENLFALHLRPTQIYLLTHESDERNRSLWDFARANGIETADFPAKSDDAFEWISRHEPNILFSLHYRQRIPKRILKIPTFGCVNLHPSLVPNYRGCCSVPWAIINGERTTGYTYHYMVEQFDEGNIILQKSVEIGDTDTAFSLFHRLIIQGMSSFEVVFKKLVEHNDPGTPQPKGGSYYPRKLPYNGRIDTNWDKSKIERFIRAMYFPPYKGAVVSISGEEFEIGSLDDYKALMRQQRGKIK